MGLDDHERDLDEQPFAECLPEARYCGNQIRHYFDKFLAQTHVTILSPFKDEAVEGWRI